jgi:hypothetical protein
MQNDGPAELPTTPGSTADKMAKQPSELAVVAALAPVCADKFRALPDAEAKAAGSCSVHIGGDAPPPN